MKDKEALKEKYREIFVTVITFVLLYDVILERGRGVWGGGGGGPKCDSTQNPFGPEQ
jgi:hypothetical protein